MELTAILAVIGLSWGIASDIIGSSRSPAANSVVGWVSGKAKRYLRGRSKPPIPVTSLDTVKSCASLRRTCTRRDGDAVECGKLIEVGWFYRRQLLRDPDVKTVDVAIMGTHLVLTAYKEYSDD